MRIISLQAENVKRLRAIEIVPDGDTVIIGGRNAQGKSSVLDAIWMALAGAAGSKGTPQPIREGEKKARVVLDLEDLVVTRKWTGSGTSLEVTAQDGARYPSPQSVLDGLVGHLSFDPLAFARQDPKRQLATLLEVIGLPFDPAVLATQRRGLYDMRTEANRAVSYMEAQLEGLPPVPDGTPDEESSAAAIASELQAAIDDERMRTGLCVALNALSERITELKFLLKDAEEEHYKVIKEIGELPAPVEMARIHTRLDEVDATNAAVRTKLARAQLLALLEERRGVSRGLTEEIEGIDARRAGALAGAEMPVDGLSFDEDGILLDGIPLSQASSSEQLRVGIAIAMAVNPKIRVIRITDGSLLDSESLALIDRMVGANDFQAWIERVDETGTVGITIEDGRIVGRGGGDVPLSSEEVTELAAVMDSDSSSFRGDIDDADEAQSSPDPTF